MSVCCVVCMLCVYVYISEWVGGCMPACALVCVRCRGCVVGVGGGGVAFSGAASRVSGGGQLADHGEGREVPAAPGGELGGGRL